MKEHDLNSFFYNLFSETEAIAQMMKNQTEILAKMVKILDEVRHFGHRVFICGVGGGAGNGSHLAGDLFKSCQIKVVCLSDNTPTITAITNDEGWSEVFIEQLRTWQFSQHDVLFIFSVGGGDAERNISTNIVKAVKFAKEKDAFVLGIVGKSDGYTALNGDAVIVVPTVNKSYLTTHTESWQAYIGHLLTEALRQRSAKWEGINH